MTDKILVPTDGSPASDNALTYAVKLAKMYDSELIVLNVINFSIATVFHGVSIKQKLKEELEERAKRIVGRSVNNARSMGVNAEGEVRQGSPDKEIIALTKERSDILLIVMGAYGKNFLERQLVGSKTEGVLRRLPGLKVPLVVVPHPHKK